MLQSIVFANFLSFCPAPIPLDLKPLNLLIGSSSCRFLLAMGASPLPEGSASMAPAPAPLS